MKERNNANRKEGKRFEKQLALCAAAQGVLAIKNGQEIRYLPGARMIAVKSQLDWTLVYSGGKTLFADTKSFERDVFTFAQINPAQLALAASFEERGVTAGFIVLFRALGVVSFFGGRYILAKGKRSRFTPTDGLALGQADGFSLSALAGLSPISSVQQCPQRTPAPQATTPD